MNLAPAIESRKYIARETVIGMVINTLLSCAFAFAVAHGRTTIPLWGAKGIAVDFIPQTFLMMFAVTLAVTLLTRKRLRAGQVLPMQKGGSVVARLPQNAFLRALTVGLVLAVVLTPLCSGVLHLAGVDGVSARAFITLKAIYGAVVTAFVTPTIVKAAMVPPMRP